MRYKVYNRVTRIFEDEFCIVTQDGKVTFWDDVGGWCSVALAPEDSNDKYVIIFQEGEFLDTDKELEHIILEEFRNGR